jgi:beta-glucosidase
LNAGVDRPVKELKGFQKVSLKPGESKTVSIQLSSRDLQYWDEATHGWKIDHGSYEVLAGSSSADIRSKVTIRY